MLYHYASNVVQWCAWMSLTLSKQGLESSSSKMRDKHFLIRIFFSLQYIQFLSYVLICVFAVSRMRRRWRGRESAVLSASLLQVTLTYTTHNSHIHLRLDIYFYLDLVLKLSLNFNLDLYFVARIFLAHVDIIRWWILVYCV